MITIREYACPATLEEAWQLNQKRTNRVLGGMLWLKMEKIGVGTVIDLSALGLDRIEENDAEFAIGAMVSLRALETNAALNAYTHGAVREAVRHIVGVQFRNCATVGGSVWGRFGFSDVLTLLLALDCDVELYKAGRMPLAQFVNLPYDRDILTHVYIKKTPGLAVHYQSVRATQTDFPILTCAAARTAVGTYRFAVGARPMKAILVCPDAAPADLPAAVQAAVPTGSNMRGSAAYRSHLAGVLAKRAVQALEP
ncbi:FAD binding domain-containing protein [Gemmiger sp.]